ncbi:hypothetical protein F5X68DRAFT_237098 [Plectosphaerella plurivora]|uniref:Rhodopsin domain-containing protein n=1 Tax=Plectosphaerella plurivora TaxID=936078 RepID=A0A9P8V216_9PEZI|nr:hypothetical protein F5X68DRAFT_237098 [Plectosphaerella plurivora]
MAFPFSGGHSLAIAVCNITLGLVGILIATLRLHVARVTLRWKIDDTLMVFAVIFGTVQAAWTGASGWLGSGAPMDQITTEQLRRNLYYTRWIGVPFYNLGTITVKASALTFFLRFTTSRRFHWVVYATIAVTVASGILNIVGTSVGCTDLLSECPLTARVYIVTASTNVLTDLIILSMPFFILAPMRTMAPRRKIGLTFVMTTVGFVVGISIYRLVAIIALVNPPDFSVAWGWNILWSCIETQVSLICANLPQMRAVYKRYVHETDPPRLGMVGSMFVNVYRFSAILRTRIHEMGRDAGVQVSSATVAFVPTVQESERPRNEDWFHELSAAEQAHLRSYHLGAKGEALDPAPGDPGPTRDHGV